MKVRSLLFVVSQMVLVTSIIAQNDVDALRYSMTTFGGTARYMSMAGAFGSLGADFSTLSSNPAGIGLYSKSEFTVTPSFYMGKTKSDYRGVASDDHQFNFNLSNYGFIMASEPSRSNQSIFRNFQFGFGVNRINNFNTRMLMEGFNDQNSIIDTYVEYASGIPYENIDSDLNGLYAFDLNPAWYTYLIDTLPGFIDQYRGAVPSGGGVSQRKEVYTRGSMNEMVISGGTNIQDRFFIGLTLGIPFLRYFQESLYTEMDVNSIYDFRRLTIYDELSTIGTGFNVKFGLIARPTDWMRVSGAIHSPTWFSNMNDSWHTKFTSESYSRGYITALSPYGDYKYNLETPMRALGGLSFILYNRALISADYEFIDFSQSRFRAGDYGFYDENRAISKKYTATHNIRAGSEIRFDQLAVRAGFGYYMSPYADNINDGSRYYYTGGFGYREENFFVDLAYVYSIQSEDYYFYGSPDVYFDPVKNKNISSNFIVTIGLRM